MANKQKKTQKEWYAEIIDLLETLGGHEDKVEFLQGRVEMLNKKTSTKKETEKQKANQELAQAVYKYMELDKMYTITDLMKEVPAFQEIDPLSNQFATNIVKILKDSGLVIRVVDKGRAKFVKVEGEGE